MSLRLFKIEGFGSSLATTTQWLSPLVDRLRLPGVDIVSTTFAQFGDDGGRVGAAMLANDAGKYTRQAILAHSYACAAAVRALAVWAARGGVLDAFLAEDAVPRWLWGQFPGWTAPKNVRVISHWYQRNLGPTGEPFKLPTYAPGETRILQGLFQTDLSSRGVLHTDVPLFPEVQSAVVAIVRPLAAA